MQRRLERLFRSAMAEREKDACLTQVFEPPPRWREWITEDSVLVIGPPGSGRTAAARQMVAVAQEAGAFAFPWRPEAGRRSQSSRVPLWEQIGRDILRQGIEALLGWLAQDPERSSPFPEWGMAWLRALGATLLSPQWLARLPAWFPPAQYVGLETLQQRLSAVRDPLPGTEGLSCVEIARSLVLLVQAAGMSAVWVVIDLPPYQAQTAFASLRALTEVLQWFDLPHWVFKLLLPEGVAENLRDTVAILRRRLWVERIRWTPEALRRLVERRLRWGTEGVWQSLADLVAEPEGEFLPWLVEYGGRLPRAWLSLLWPVIEARLRSEAPLSAQAWREVVRQHPPPLYLDEERQLVYLGAKPYVLESQEAWNLLHFLYRHCGHLCTREALYYQGLERLPRVPDFEDSRREAPTQWRGRLDTALYRLRQALEPDPNHPVYIITQRRRGVKLRCATRVLGLLPEEE